MERENFNVEVELARLLRVIDNLSLEVEQLKKENEELRNELKTLREKESKSLEKTIEDVADEIAYQLMRVREELSEIKKILRYA